MKVYVTYEPVVFDSSGEPIAGFDVERYDLSPGQVQVFEHARKNDGIGAAWGYALNCAKVDGFDPKAYGGAPVEFARPSIMIQP